ncbi:Riboflavin synthase alpha chain [Xylographa carneopallida]|nr:Riboflavin synthase alpha chain [Xylographa carneopallida]
MFTGLIEDIGVVTDVRIDPTTQQTIITIRASSPALLSDCHLGDSIAVSGCCLTVTHFDAASRTFTVGLSPETLRRTTFAELRRDTPVNLERSMTANTRIGGHYVQGHVDGVGQVRLSQRDGDALRVVVACSGAVLQYVVEKGYIAIDGTSLTVTRVDERLGELEVMLIQYTQSKITLPRRKVGEGVNLEADIMGKQIVAYLQKYDKAIKAKL